MRYYVAANITAKPAMCISSCTWRAFFVSMANDSKFIL